jgi:hypothetical protein
VSCACGRHRFVNGSCCDHAFKSELCRPTRTPCGSAAACSDPALVWREIHTHIRGSLAAVATPNGGSGGGGGGRLSREAYLELGRARSGAELGNSQRQSVFELFL